MKRLIRFFVTWIHCGLNLCALLLVLAAVYVSLGRELVLLVAEYRTEIEVKAQTIMKMPVYISSLEGRWRGFMPILLAHNVVIGTGNNALRINHSEVMLDIWASLIAREIRIANLEVSGLQVVVKEGNNNYWSLQGLPVQDDQSLDLERLLTHMHIVKHVSLLDSQVTLQPHSQESLTMTHVGFSFNADTARQRLDACLILPDGQPLSLSIHGRIRDSGWKDSEIEAYLNLPQSDWAKWIPARLAKQWRITQFNASGEFWFNWSHGIVQSAVVHLNSSQVKGSYADRQPVHIENLALTVNLKRSDNGLNILFDSLAMNIGSIRLESHLQLQQSLATNKNLEVWTLQTNRLDLNLITILLKILAPLPDDFIKTIEHLNATGVLHNVLVNFCPQDTTDHKVSFAANLEQISFDAYFGVPAVRNMSGSINGDLGHGELQIDSKDFALHLYPMFAKPWQYIQAHACLTWNLDKAGITLVAPYIKMLSEEGKLAASFLINLHLDHTKEDYMDLKVNMVDSDERFTSKYLPVMLGQSLTEWLHMANFKGAVDQAFFRYKGSLNHDPLSVVRNISLFFRVHNAELAFQPGWPYARKINGEVFIEKGGLHILANTGQILNTKIKDVHVSIPYVKTGKDNHLLITGKFEGGLGDGLRILQDTPIGTNSIFADWKGDGDLQGTLDLDIPLIKDINPNIAINFHIDKARLQLAKPAMNLTQLKGDFRFDSSKGLNSTNISAKAFGRQITVQILPDGKPNNMSTCIIAKGWIAVKQLANWLEIKHPLPISGDISYKMRMTLDGADSQLIISSSMKGVMVDLPAPFGMPSNHGRYSVFRMTLQGLERRYWFDYGNLASFAFASPQDKFNDGRGELFIGDGNVVLPVTKGLRVRGILSELNIDPWKKLLSHYACNDSGDSFKQLFSSADLMIAKLTGFGSNLDQVNLQLNRKTDSWSLQLDSQQAKGTVTIPDAKDVPVAVNMQYVKLPIANQTIQFDENAPDPLVDIDPKSIFALDISINQLFQGQTLVGTWSFKVKPTAKGVVFNNINLGLKGLQLKGTGGWEGAPGTNSSWYNGRLNGQNIADVLKGWGFTPIITSADFYLDVIGRWPGSPVWVSLKRFSGSLDALLSKGQFVEVEGGAKALRVFGLLNLNSIGRRLRLDFSDLLGKGLSYDLVKGSLSASNGVLVTREPITITGPSANLELNSALDLVADRVDAKLLVMLPVTNNLPIAALIVGAPAISGALFLIDQLAGDRIARFVSVQYKVHGSWKNPKITFDKPF
ncbi:YhdP family protein [Candidatus Pseudomonas adelgestsugas]|uniref:TIGR02099 family protein n=1 Tax=Candidatus Pseudomonas adelgestsugas TaxID=1302376 RepID=A0ABX5R8I1_9PSED|nr:YhdP family protein [Candidatus Pseudomonas adelgestsugas]QAX81863.1 TIGR02099 family protein [Candidatus Pseudomonas adelgestsugas]